MSIALSNPKIKKGYEKKIDSNNEGFSTSVYLITKALIIKKWKIGWKYEM